MSRQTFLNPYFFLFKTKFEQIQYKKIKWKEITKSIDKHKKNEVIKHAIMFFFKKEMRRLVDYSIDWSNKKQCVPLEKLKPIL